MKKFNVRAICEYLMYRYVYDGAIAEKYSPRVQSIDFPRTPVKSSDELINVLRGGGGYKNNSALALSGGIDSAILAKFMPKGSTAYTFRCIVPGVKVIDETEKARLYAEICGLNHKVIDIYWKDIEAVIDDLMRHKGAPVHSIEAQIYIAAKKVKQDGFDNFIFGENADIIYGGMDGLLAKDWLIGEFIDRYTYIMPYKVLRNAEMPLEPYLEFERDGHIDGHDFINKYFRQEALGTYNNACDTAGVNFIGPYSLTFFDAKIDYERIRKGDTKYIIREAFKKLYPDLEIPEKIPMPRPMNEWFKNWQGPKRPEFYAHCADGLNGDQKWMLWSLERFLNLVEQDGEF